MQHLHENYYQDTDTNVEQKSEHENQNNNDNLSSSSSSNITDDKVENEQDDDEDQEEVENGHIANDDDDDKPEDNYLKLEIMEIASDFKLYCSALFEKNHQHDQTLQDNLLITVTKLFIASAQITYNNHYKLLNYMGVHILECAERLITCINEDYVNIYVIFVIAALYNHFYLHNKKCAYTIMRNTSENNYSNSNNNNNNNNKKDDTECKVNSEDCNKIICAVVNFAAKSIERIALEEYSSHNEQTYLMNILNCFVIIDVYINTHVQFPGDKVTFEEQFDIFGKIITPSLQFFAKYVLENTHYMSWLNDCFEYITIMSIACPDKIMCFPVVIDMLKKKYNTEIDAQKIIYNMVYYSKREANIVRCFKLSITSFFLNGKVTHEHVFGILSALNMDSNECLLKIDCIAANRIMKNISTVLNKQISTKYNQVIYLSVYRGVNLDMVINIFRLLQKEQVLACFQKHLDADTIISLLVGLIHNINIIQKLRLQFYLPFKSICMSFIHLVITRIINTQPKNNQYNTVLQNKEVHKIQHLFDIFHCFNHCIITKSKENRKTVLPKFAARLVGLYMMQQHEQIY